MKYIKNVTFFVVLLQCCACSGYGDSQKVSFTQFNDSIAAGASRGEPWAQKPETICKHLFPSEAYSKGDINYSVKTHCPGNTSCEVTVVDEGELGDELAGQKWQASFEKNPNSWQMTSLQRSSKKR
jgi:hypothetical protein